MKNPANLAKHQANPKVAPVIAKMMSKFGGPKWTLLDVYLRSQYSRPQPSGKLKFIDIAFFILVKLSNFLQFVRPVS